MTPATARTPSRNSDRAPDPAAAASTAHSGRSAAASRAPLRAAMTVVRMAIDRTALIFVDHLGVLRVTDALARAGVRRRDVQFNRLMLAEPAHRRLGVARLPGIGL